MRELIITIDESKADPDGGIPIKDKREVVRCRDCTVYDGEGYGCSYGRGDDPDGFCAWGTRKEDA